MNVVVLFEVFLKKRMTGGKERWHHFSLFFFFLSAHEDTTHFLTLWNSQDKSHLKTVTKVKVAGLQLTSWPALNFLLFFIQKKKQTTQNNIAKLCTCNYRSLRDKPGDWSERMPCWFKLLLGKHTEMRIKWKLLFSDATLLKSGRVILIDLVCRYIKVILCVSTAERVGKMNWHGLILEK